MPTFLLILEIAKYKNKSMKLNKSILMIIAFMGCANYLFSQDPAFTSFQSCRTLFNPSFVGLSGSESFQLKTKYQWYNKADPSDRYQTINFLFEEPLPCKQLLDVGLKFNHNSEGKARFKTTEMGILSCITLNTKDKLGYNNQNIRIGGDFTFGFNQIDYSNLIFSDQLDPKKGPIKTTSFLFPSTDPKWYFNQGIGISYVGSFKSKTHKSFTINTGLAAYRAYGLIDINYQHSNGLLDTNYIDPYRLTFHFQYERDYVHLNSFLSRIRYYALIQKQGQLDYFEVGSRVGIINNRLALNANLHGTFLPAYTNNTKWIAMGIEYRNIVRKGRMIEFNATYAWNIGGLSNFIGPTMEVGISYHLNRSMLCGKDNIYEVNCTDLTLPINTKIYENIWYKN